MSALPSLFSICEPREDILKGELKESDFAADLAQVLNETAPDEYKKAKIFFANTYPTKGLKVLLENVCRCLIGSNERISSIFRLDTNFGGGKTHALIALNHIVNQRIQEDDEREYVDSELLAEFIDPQLLPQEKVCVAAFDGENADPANGRLMDKDLGLRAYTPWGEMAYMLGKSEGYAKVRKSDELGIAPGAETIHELFGDRPVLLLMDELAIYLRKQLAKNKDATNQLSAFLSALFRAVDSSKRAVLIYTLAIGKKTSDAYSLENEYIAKMMEEAESISARTVTILNPTTEDETAKVLCRRLFKEFNSEGVQAIITKYRDIWDFHKDNLPPEANEEGVLKTFQDGFPLHPELMATLKEKIATLNNFQRVRGMLRLLARTVHMLWQKKPAHTYAIHLHHIDLANNAIRQEFLTRLGQDAFAPAINADITAVQGDLSSLAESADCQNVMKYQSFPYTTSVARCIFFHTLAFNEDLIGATDKQINFSVLAPELSMSSLNEARAYFIERSAYLADAPNHPYYFKVQPNLNQLIRRYGEMIKDEDVREKLKEYIQRTFCGDLFKCIFFPANANDVDDKDIAKPLLAVMWHEATSVSCNNPNPPIPRIVQEIFKLKSAMRVHENNVVFAVVDENQIKQMLNTIRLFLGLNALKDSSKMKDLDEHQQKQVKERLDNVNKEDLPLSILQAYRCIFYPCKSENDEHNIHLASTFMMIDNQSATRQSRPTNGQIQVMTLLRGVHKLLRGEDRFHPRFIFDAIPKFNKDGLISTQYLWDEFLSNVALPILENKVSFDKTVKFGIKEGEWIYKSGHMLCGKGDPPVVIEISEQAVLMTNSYVRDHKIWPKELAATKVSLVKKDPDGKNTKIIDPTNQPQDMLIEEDNCTLSQAFEHIRTKIEQNNMQYLTALDITIYDALQGLALFAIFNQLAECEKKTLKIQGVYEISDGSRLSLDYDGTLNAGKTFIAFLSPQLRLATNSDVAVSYAIQFAPEHKLAVNEVRKLAENLVKLCKDSRTFVRVKATI